MKQALLHIKDEVNVKIEGLDLDVRKKLVDMFKFEVPGARYMPAVRLGRINMFRSIGIFSEISYNVAYGK